jgi:hypothetical protein
VIIIIIISSNSGDRLDFTNHIYEMCRLVDADFRSVENTAFGIVTRTVALRRWRR